jgi:hypothetical protein
MVRTQERYAGDGEEQIANRKVIEHQGPSPRLEEWRPQARRVLATASHMWRLRDPLLNQSDPSATSRGEALRYRCWF